MTGFGVLPFEYRQLRLVSYVFKSVFVFLLIFLISTSNGWSKDYRVRKKTKGFTADISINRNPPVLGDNAITIKIKGPSGDLVTNASVYVNYYMPPMPGMPPMNYTTPAPLEGKEYRATMDLIMTGPWNIVIKVKGQDGSFRVVFPIDVR